jgi:ATP-dependent DNA helicase RecG
LIGISENPDNVSEFLKAIDKEIDPPLAGWRTLYHDIVNVKGLKDQLLVIHVLKSDEVHSLKKGETLARRGRQNVKLTAREILRLQHEKGAVKFESELSGIRSLEPLDQNLMRTYKRDTASENQDDWQFLRDNGLAAKNGEESVLTNAAALLFGKNPSIALGRKCGIKISHYYGTKPTYSGEPNFVRRPISIEGPLLSQIEQTVTYFRNLVKEAPPKLKGASFRSSFAIPEWVFQEAVTNAVIHRNYFSQDDIQIRFFDDRVEVESPGSYPGHMTVNNIRTERYARNPLIQRTLNRFQAAPNLDIGEGVDRMFQVMREKILYDPLYFPPTIRPNSVLVTLFNLHRVEYWDTVSKYLDKHYRITNSEARRITGVKDTLRMSRLLKLWVEKGVLVKVGDASKKGTYYTKPGQEPSPTLFSLPPENK